MFLKSGIQSQHFHTFTCFKWKRTLSLCIIIISSQYVRIAEVQIRGTSTWSSSSLKHFQSGSPRIGEQLGILFVTKKLGSDDCKLSVDVAAAAGVLSELDSMFALEEGQRTKAETFLRGTKVSASRLTTGQRL